MPPSRTVRRRRRCISVHVNIQGADYLESPLFVHLTRCHGRVSLHMDTTPVRLVGSPLQHHASHSLTLSRWSYLQAGDDDALCSLRREPFLPALHVCTLPLVLGVNHLCGSCGFFRDVFCDAGIQCITGDVPLSRSWALLSMGLVWFKPVEPETAVAHDLLGGLIDGFSLSIVGLLMIMKKVLYWCLGRRCTRHYRDTRAVYGGRLP